MNIKTQIEIQRILNVLDEAIDDIAILTHIPSYMSQFKEDVLQQFDPQTKKSLENMFDAERELELKIKNGEHHQKIAKQASIVKEHVRQVCFNLTKFGYYKEENKELWNYSETMDRFLSLFKELRDLWADKLNTTVEEAQIKLDQKNEAAARDKKASADVKALQRELASEKSIHEREVSLREDALNKLNEELTQLKQESERERKEFEQIINAREEQEHSQFKELYDHLNEEIEKTKAAIVEMRKSNQKRERDLKDARKKVEAAVEDWIMKYDRFMSKTTEKVSTLKVNV